MDEKRDDPATPKDEELSEADDVYVLEDSDEISYEALLEEVEATGGGSSSEPVGLAPADQSDESVRLKAENQEMKDRYLRILADHENFKRRTEKERIETWGMAVGEMIREILPVLDNLERAIQSGRVHDPDSEMLSGVEMIYDQLIDVLRHQGVSVNDRTGVEFDPEIHEGVQRVEDPDVPAHTVVEVLQKGYSLKGRLIRPAMVKVAVGGPEKSARTQGEQGEREEE